MPGRHYSNGDLSYRYGFNGMEKDDEVKGSGNHYDLGMRHYDPRLGRMFKIDPRSSEYAWQTPYAYHRNSPVSIIDFLGGGDDKKTVTNPNKDKKANEIDGHGKKVERTKTKTEAVIDGATEGTKNFGAGLGIMAAGPFGGMYAAYNQALILTDSRTSTLDKVEAVVGARIPFTTPAFGLAQTYASYNSVSEAKGTDAGISAALEEGASRSTTHALNGALVFSFMKAAPYVFKNKTGNYTSPSVENLTDVSVEQYVKNVPLDKFGNYNVYGSKGLAGDVFVYDLALVEKEGGVAMPKSFGAMRAVMYGIERQARASGATSIEIRGHSVIAQELNNYFLGKQGVSIGGWKIYGGTTSGSNVTIIKSIPYTSTPTPLIIGTTNYSDNE